MNYLSEKNIFAGKKIGVNWSQFWQKEDWWTVWIAVTLILFSLFKLVSRIPVPGNWNTNPLQAFAGAQFFHFLLLGGGLALITGLAITVMREKVHSYLVSFPIVFGLSLLAFTLSRQVTLNRYQFDSVIWALLLGLLISNTVGLPRWLAPAARTELFIKTGLVLMGAEILFSRILLLGTYGLGVAWLVTPIVLIFMFIMGTKLFKIESKALVATISAATSVCGVSAAIAAGAATRARREEISYAISLSLLFTVLMMIVFPNLIKLAGLSEAVGGALIGGTIDSTGAVVVAGTMVGKKAMEVAAIIKMIQNTLIGVVAFFLSLYWVTRVEQGAPGSRPSLLQIWERFPKFIIGFVLASVFFSFILTPALGAPEVDNILKLTRGLRNWLFCLAFVSIGLESSVSRLMALGKGGRPIYLYITGQLFNIVLTYLAAVFFFGGKFFPTVM